MIDINELSDEVRESILKNRDAEDESEEVQKKIFEAMSVEDAFAYYCEWHGLLGWAGQLRRALDDIRGATNA